VARPLPLLRQALGRARWLRMVLHRAHQPATGDRRGRALLSYLSAPVGVPEEELPTAHTQHWESAEIARLLAEAGFDTDVLHYHDRWFRPRGTYDVVVDVRRNLERLAPLVGDRALKVFHADTAHTPTLVAAEQRRLDALEVRRGVRLQARRQEPPHRALEVADAATVLGNEVTLATYRHAGIPLHPVPTPSALRRPFDAGKDHDAARRRFLWLGSAGMVHKGLDLVLEVFAANPDLHLTVCGPVEGEPDFVEAYRRELRETPNIELAGFVDVTGPGFARLAARTGALVYPSSSEGCAGSVVTAMHAGLVPVVSRESGVDVADAGGVVLETSTPEEIAEAVRGVAEQPPAEVGRRARAAWERANERYTREAFTARYRAALASILDTAGGT
jgi:glycosyltransferase involved in cell wall biosynthesis